MIVLLNLSKISTFSISISSIDKNKRDILNGYLFISCKKMLEVNNVDKVLVNYSL
jgi:hypothetical protein